MPVIRFTSHLQRFFPELQNGMRVDGETVAAVVNALNARYPGFADYVVDERGALRKHVNIFIGENLIHDRERLKDALAPGDQVFIMQALSGG